MRKTDDAKPVSPNSDAGDQVDDETTPSAPNPNETAGESPEDPDNPLNDPQVKAGFEKLQDLLNEEGDVEVKMGRELNRVNEALKGKNGRHGRWGKILKDELGIGYKKASRARAHAKFHAWAEETDNLDHLSKIPRSACYLLGGPRTTDVQREDAIRRATEDGSIDIETVKRIVHGEGDVGDPESPEDRTFRCLAEGFKRWLKKFKEADEKNQDRVINEVRKRHREFVASICPHSEQTEKPKAKSKSA